MRCRDAEIGGPHAPPIGKRAVCARHKKSGPVEEEPGRSI